MYSGVDRGHGTTLLSIHRGQDRAVCRSDSHQIFVEPEGLNTRELYPNGISTSLPFDLQLDFVQSIRGFEKAHITRPGYAIEYDFFDPRELHGYLETRHVPGLFFAGQINGTTGYEEAAAQGLVAGINAARKTRKESMWSPRRDESYMGVMIDDLVTQGTQEPYRMFTSRAEYRLHLREDNADLRLTEKGRELGLVETGVGRCFAKSVKRSKSNAKGCNHLGCARQRSGQGPGIQAWVAVSKESRALDLLKRPEMDYGKARFDRGCGPWHRQRQVAEQVEIQVRYAGYLDRQEDDIKRRQRNEGTADFHQTSIMRRSRPFIGRQGETGAYQAGNDWPGIKNSRNDAGGDFDIAGAP